MQREHNGEVSNERQEKKIKQVKHLAIKVQSTCIPDENISLANNKSSDKLKVSHGNIKGKIPKLQIDEKYNKDLSKLPLIKDSSIEKLAQIIQIEKELISESLSDTERFDIDERNPSEKYSIPNKTSLINSNPHNLNIHQVKSNNFDFELSNKETIFIPQNLNNYEINIEIEKEDRIKPDEENAKDCVHKAIDNILRSTNYKTMNTNSSMKKPNIPKSRNIFESKFHTASKPNLNIDTGVKLDDPLSRSKKEAMMVATPRCEVVNLDLIGSFHDNEIEEHKIINENSKDTKISAKIQVTPYEENKSVFSQSRATSNHQSFTEFNTIEHHFDEDDQYSNNLNPYYKVSLKSIQKMKEEYEKQIQEHISINNQLRLKIDDLQTQLNLRNSISNKSEEVIVQPKTVTSQILQTDEDQNIKKKQFIDNSTQIDKIEEPTIISVNKLEESKVESNSSLNNSKIQPKILTRAKTESESMKVQNLQNKLK